MYVVSQAFGFELGQSTTEMARAAEKSMDRSSNRHDPRAIEACPPEPDRVDAADRVRRIHETKRRNVATRTR